MISRSQLIERGWSSATVARAAHSGTIERKSSGVYLVAGAPLTYRARLWWAVLATDGAVGYRTGAQLWGLLEPPLRTAPEPPLRTGAEPPLRSGAEPPERVDVVLSHYRRVYPPNWVIVHRAGRDPASIVHVDGLPCTNRPWTLFDLLPQLTWSRACTLADRALQRGWFTPEELVDHLDRYPRRRGNVRLRRLADRLGDGAAAESERVLHRLLRQYRLTGWVPNYALWVDGELVGVADLAWPLLRLAIEVDGWAFHSDVDRFQRDRRRQNGFVTAGWTVLRFTWADLVERPGYVAHTVARVVAQASA